MNRGGHAARHKVLKTALGLLRYISEHRLGVTINQMVRDCKVPRRNIYHYLTAFKEVGIRLHKFRMDRGVEANWRLVTPDKHRELVGIL